MMQKNPRNLLELSIMCKVNVSGYELNSTVDGAGIRFVLFTQGCPHNCEGCHNEGTHSFSENILMDKEQIISLIKKNPLIDGVTISGGEPLVQWRKLVPILKETKDLGYNIWLYTGYTYEEILDRKEKIILDYVDVLVDGKFEKRKKTLKEPFKGSLNQRVIDILKTKRENEIILFKDQNKIPY